MTDGGSGTGAGAAAARPPRGLSYNQVRILMLVGGLLLLGITAAVNYVRRVETAEVVGILLFIPIFIAFVFWDWKGGLIAAALATVIYILLRRPAIEAIGAGRYTGLIFSRAQRVTTWPGDTELTRTSGASAIADARVSWRTPALESPYTTDEPAAR